MADLASASSDLADETVDAAPTDPTIATPDEGGDDLLGELARAMHAAATSQYQRLNSDLERRRTEQVAAIAERASAEAETLKADAETDIGSIDAWAKVETEKVKLERLRRIDARREQLAAQLDRQQTIKEREAFAIEVAIDAHRNEMELFFGRLERETDPSEIARVASTMPAFPSLDDVVEQARRTTAAEFATIEGQAAAPSGVASSEPIDASSKPIDMNGAAEVSEVTFTDATTLEDSATVAKTELGSADDAVTDLEPAAAVSETRLKAVIDPAASRGENETTQPWEAPYAVSVAAGPARAEDEPTQQSVGSTLLRTVRSIRPMAGRHDKDPDEGGTAG
jgi:hypothetical protein